MIKSDTNDNDDIISIRIMCLWTRCHH